MVKLAVKLIQGSLLFQRRASLSRSAIIILIPLPCTTIKYISIYSTFSFKTPLEKTSGHHLKTNDKPVSTASHEIWSFKVSIVIPYLNLLCPVYYLDSML